MTSAGLRLKQSWAKWQQGWRLIGTVQLRSRRVLQWVIFSHLLISLIFEPNRLGVPVQEIVTALLVAELVFWIMYLTLDLALARLLGNRYAAFGKIFVTAVVSHTVRVYMLEFGYSNFDPGFEFDPSRLVGDISGALLLFVSVGYIVSAGRLHQLSISEIAEKSKLLHEQRRSVRSAIDDVESGLREKAQAALGKELQTIKELLTEGNSSAIRKASDEIQELIKDRVRPLSGEIWNQVARIDSPALATDSVPKPELWPKYIYLKHGFRSTVIWLFAMTNITATAFGLGDVQFATVLAGVSISFLVIGGVLRALTPRTIRFRFGLGLLITIFFALIAFLPTWIYLFAQSLDQPEVAVLSITAPLLLFFVTTGVATWSGFEKKREEYLAELSELNEALSRELDLLDQAVWVAKRNWTYLIHGTVQGSLTLAHSRLKLAKTPTDAVMSQALADIDRAREALSNPEILGQDPERMLKELADTWAGVIKVTVDLDPLLAKRLAENSTAATCAIEIAKELTSNAFRHAGAKKIAITLELTESGEEFEMVAVNDGKPVSEDLDARLGSQLFEHLCSSWELVPIAKGSRFKASVPLGLNLEAIPTKS